MSILLTLLVLFGLGAISLFLILVIMQVSKTQREFNRLIDERNVLEIEIAGLEREIEQCHNEIDARDQRIRELNQEINGHRIHVETRSRRGWSEF
jgi:uncharacterized coiled-coil DUF342 family protein